MLYTSKTLTVANTESAPVKITNTALLRLTGTWVGTVHLKYSYNNVEYVTVGTFTSNTVEKILELGYYKFVCTAYTSGSIVGYIESYDYQKTNLSVNSTSDYIVTKADYGKSIRINSASNRTVYLPSVDTEDDGVRIKIIKLGAGNLVIQAADSDKIADSTAGGTVTCSVSTEIFAWLELEYIHDTTTWIMSGHGIWVTA